MPLYVNMSQLKGGSCPFACVLTEWRPVQGASTFTHSPVVVKHTDPRCQHKKLRSTDDIIRTAIW